MGKYPYILNTGKLQEFLEMIPKIGVPPKITTKTLPTLGFKSTNDRPIVGILRFIDFVDTSGLPTQNYRDFRVQGKAKTVMASVVRKAYSDLFEIYQNANEKEEQSLKDFFKPTTDAGDRVVNETVNTFRTLCSFADFGVVAEVEAKPEKEEEKHETRKERTTPASQGLTINLNIQLTLPATDNEKVYENIFKALRSNLLSPEPKED